jgi:hypothetical protein
MKALTVLRQPRTRDAPQFLADSKESDERVAITDERFRQVPTVVATAVARRSADHFRSKRRPRFDSR